MSFISAARLGQIPGDHGFMPIPPDLAVEGTSPNDRLVDVFLKAKEYLDAGVGLVWIVIPDVREVHVRTPNGKTVVLTNDDPLTGGDVLPGFACAVSDLFICRTSRPTNVRTSDGFCDFRTALSRPTSCEAKTGPCPVSSARCQGLVN